MYKPLFTSLQWEISDKIGDLNEFIGGFRVKIDNIAALGEVEGEREERSPRKVSHVIIYTRKGWIDILIRDGNWENCLSQRLADN